MIAFLPNKNLLAVGFVIFLLVACSFDRPSYVIDEDDMEEILYDYHIAQALAEQEHDSTAWYRYVYVQKVFEKHNISEAEFDTSMIWYSSNTNHLLHIYTRLRERLNKELETISGNADSDDYMFADNGDTSVVWRGEPLVALQRGTKKNSYSFSINVDTTSQQRDIYMWIAHQQSLLNEGSWDGVSTLSLHYEGDSVVSQVHYHYDNRNINFSIYTDTTLILKRVSGFFYIETPVDEDLQKNVCRVFLFNPKLVRIHQK